MVVTSPQSVQKAVQKIIKQPQFKIMEYFCDRKEMARLCRFFSDHYLIIRRMKLTIIFILFAVGLHATTRGQQINLSVKQMRLESVLKKISQQTDYKFFYSTDLINKVEPINLTVEQASLEETLEKILIPRGLGYQKMSRTITITATNTLQQIEVSGTVNDGKGPISGVNIYTKANNKIGTRTDSEGKFSLKIPSNATLVFSFLGYEKKEIVVKDRELHVVLNPISNAMAEVVVTALGINKEKRKVAYAAQEVKGESLSVAREPNVASSLVGKVAGLQIKTKSTLFENPEITLRGGNATIVIDGVPAPDGFNMWSINADDIENITVLKGTASSALYGSVAQNGAIMITTKKGKGGKAGIELTYNSSTEFQAGFLRIPKTQQDYGMGFNGKYAFVDGKGGGINDAYGYVWGPKLNQPDPSTASGFVEIPQYNSPLDPETNKLKPLPWISRGKENLNNFLTNGLITTHNLSVAGSTDKSDYRVSLSHLYQKGQVPNTTLNSTTLSLAGKLKLNSKLEAEATLSYNRQYSPNYPNSDYSPDNYLS